MTVLAPPSTGACERKGTCSHNTDAVDVHGDPFWIHSVNFTTGDDNVAGHANNTLVEDSYFGSGHGASIGSLCGSYIRNFTVRNVSFHGTTAAARIKSHPACGGHVWDVTYESEKDAKLAQKLGQLQPFLVYYHRNARAHLHLLGQPNTFLAEDLVMHDVPTPIALNQFYFAKPGDKPAVRARRQRGAAPPVLRALRPHSLLRHWLTVRGAACWRV